MKWDRSHVNFVKREVLLKDLRMANGILFPIEKEKIVLVSLFFYFVIKLPFKNAFIVKFISINPLLQR